MRNAIVIIVALIIVVVMTLSMVTYTVSFTEKAIVTTFGKVSETGVIQDDPGLKFKWPSPVQSVTIYDARQRPLDVTPIEQQTADERQVIVEPFVLWRVEDPAKFYRSFARGGGGRNPREHFIAAEQSISGQVRSSLAEVGAYTMADLFNAQGNSKIPDLEARIKEILTSGDSAIGEYGVEITMVGIKSILLPESVTTKVTERMNASREAISRRAQDAGDSEAAAIRSEGSSAAERILAFAREKADRIRSKGDLEAAQWVAVQSEIPELAEFLQRVDAFREGLGRDITLVLPDNIIGGDMFSREYLRSVEQSAKNYTPQAKSEPTPAIEPAASPESSEDEPSTTDTPAQPAEADTNA